jgi:hypothetical protein
MLLWSFYVSRRKGRRTVKMTSHVLVERTKVNFRLSPARELQAFAPALIDTAGYGADIYRLAC